MNTSKFSVVAEQDRDGFFCKGGGKERIEFLYWDDYDLSEEKTLAIEQWGEDKFEALVDNYVEEYSLQIYYRVRD